MRYVQVRPVSEEGEASFGLIRNYDASFEMTDGISLAASFPKDAKFVMDPNYPKAIKLVDVLSTAESVLVVNERVRELIEARKVPGLEFFQVHIINHKGREAKEKYFVINFLHRVDCVDRTKTQFTPNRLNPEKMIDVSDLVLDETKIDESLQLFGVKGLPTLLVATTELANHLEKANVKGLETANIADFTF